MAAAVRFAAATCLANPGHGHASLSKEEVDVTVKATGVVGIHTNPNHVVEYSDGEVRQQFSICFWTWYLSGEPYVG